MRTLAWSCLVALTLAACGDSEESACRKAGALLCQRACDCGKDKCVVATQAAAGTATISFDTEAQCTAMYVDLGCSGGGEPTIDYPACYDALKGAACAGTTPTDGVLLPAACSVSR